MNALVSASWILDLLRDRSDRFLGFQIFVEVCRSVFLFLSPTMHLLSIRVGMVSFFVHGEFVHQVVFLVQSQFRVSRETLQ
jgi:hypothetical protein